MTDDQPAADPLQHVEDRFRLLVESVRDYAVVMLDPAGRVLTWNTGAERITGYAAAEAVGQPVSEFHPAEPAARALAAQGLEAARGTGAFEGQGWHLRRDGSRFWAHVVITAIRAPDGALIGFAQVVRDLTQQRHHEEALRRSEERFRLLVEGVPDYAIFMLDANGRIATWNSGAERIKGYTAPDVIGRHFSLFYPREAQESGWPDHELQVAAEKGSFVDEGWRVRKDGTMLWANVTITALRDDGGRLLGFAKLTRDLTERRQAEAAELAGRQRDELLQAERHARMEAQRATRVKDEFLATLSHELRTPLSAILGWTQVLRRAGTTGKAVDLERAVDVIDRNARAQVKLIDDMLDLSRIMAGKVRLDLQPLSLLEVVQACVDSAMPAAEAKELRLTSRLDPGVPMLRGDGSRLQQVVWNLLTNAIKFTPRGGEVQVTLRETGRHLVLSVSDTGIGIPPTYLPQVFDRFSQQDSSTTRAFGGLGLGLAISRQLVELHGGTIRASSAGEGQGATFVVELPVAPASSPGEDVADEHAAPAVAPSESQALPRLDGVHAFIVDDEPDARELLRRILEDQGAQVTAFASAQEALAALQRARPALIVSDIGMPAMDGYQFMRALRATEGRDERIPALALTAFARAEDRKKSLLAGYQAHLAKPFDMAELVLVAANLVGRQAARAC